MSMAARHAKVPPPQSLSRALATEQLQFHGAVETWSGMENSSNSLVSLWVLPCYHVLMFTTRSDVTGTSRCCFRPGRILYFCSPCEAPPPHAKTPKDSQLMSPCAHGLKILFLNFRSAPSLNFSTRGQVKLMQSIFTLRS